MAVTCMNAGLRTVRPNRFSVEREWTFPQERVGPCREMCRGECLGLSVNVGAKWKSKGQDLIWGSSESVGGEDRAWRMG